MEIIINGDIMGRRRELGSFASGIINSFNSRNNDYDGYWAIGVLYSKVSDCVSKKIEIDLINTIIQPDFIEYRPIILEYKKMLFSYIAKRSIKEEWLVSSKIFIEFESEFIPKYHAWRSGLGRPCIMKCEIIDDKGHIHRATAYNNCSSDFKKFSRR